MWNKIIFLPLKIPKFTYTAPLNLYTHIQVLLALLWLKDIIICTEYRDVLDSWQIQPIYFIRSTNKSIHEFSLGKHIYKCTIYYYILLFYLKPRKNWITSLKVEAIDNYYCLHKLLFHIKFWITYLKPYRMLYLSFKRICRYYIKKKSIT